MLLNYIFLNPDSWVQHTLFILLSFFVAFFAYRRNSLTKAAALAAFILAAGLYLIGGPLFFILLMVFFFSSTFLSHFKEEVKEEIEKDLHEKTGKRDFVQVLANGGAAFTMAILYGLTQSENYALGVAIAFAACNADTWASEIGVLSKKAPISLITRKQVQRGMSGGVSLLGLLASFGGALLVALTYLLVRLAGGFSVNFFSEIGLILIGGSLGSLLDSILGETLQVKYRSRQTGILTEKAILAGEKNERIRGLAFVNNDFVNFASSLSVSMGMVFFFR